MVSRDGRTVTTMPPDTDISCYRSSASRKYVHSCSNELIFDSDTGARLPASQRAAAPPGPTSDGGARREGGAMKGGWGGGWGPGGERDNRVYGEPVRVHARPDGRPVRFVWRSRL